MHYSEALKTLRKNYGLTQSEVASAIGLERSTYAYYETGRSKPDLEVILKLSSLYDISVEELADIFQNGVNSSMMFRQVNETAPKNRSVAEKIAMESLSDDERLLIIYYRSCEDKKRFFDKIKNFYDNEFDD